MNRMIVGVSTTLLLSAMLLQVTPARANDFLYLDVACGGGLKLSHASGVPDGAVHSYVFGGSCSLRGMYQKGPYVDGHPPLVATAHWDGTTHTYSENLHLLTADKIIDGGHGGEFVGEIAVSTNPEVASFKCDEDPVINRGAHCSLISQHNGTGWGNQLYGFAMSARSGRPLLLGVATASQAATLSKHGSINCNDLHLVSAKGVPNGKKHSYRFHGTCSLYHTLDGSGGLRVTRVIIGGTWDAESQQADESVLVLGNTKDGAGSWPTKYTCTDDPWLNGHAKCSEVSQLGSPPPVYDPITDLAKQHPIAQGRANKKLAAELSGPKRGPSLVNRKVTAGSAHSNVKNLHLPQGPLTVNHSGAKANAHAGNLHIGASSAPKPASHIAPHGMHLSTSSPARPGAMQRGARTKMAAPNVRVLGERTRVDRSCRDTHKLIVVDATVRNDGGPLGVHQWELFVMEGGGAGLSSGGVWVPPLAPHARTHVSIPVLVLKSHIAQLPGTHWLKLISQGGGHKTTTTLSPITLARGICQPRMRMSSPAGLHPQMSRPGYPPSPCVGAKCQQAGHPQPGTRMSTPNTKLNPQPEPPSAKQRLQRLPAVQLR